MKILIISTLYFPNVMGGAERSTQILAEGLLSAGWEPVVVTTSDRDAVDSVNGVKVYYAKIPNLYWLRTAKEQPAYKKALWHLLDSINPFVGPILSRIIRQENPDIFHSSTLSGFSVQVWNVARRHEIPVVHTIRDQYLLCPRSTMFRRGSICSRQCLRCRLYSIPRKRLSKAVDAVIGVSRFTLQKHLDLGYFNRARIRTHIYNPIPKITEAEKVERDTRMLTFGFVGTLAPHKGIPLLLETFGAMNTNVAQLHVFGRGPYPGYERSLIERFQSEKIVFRGHCQPQEIYPHLDVLVVPSLWDEAFGRIVAEAYSHGIPVIVSNRGALPEITQESITGFIFNPDKQGDLEETIRRFIDDPDLIERMSSDCRVASQRFREDTIVSQYMDVYRQVVV